MSDTFTPGPWRILTDGTIWSDSAPPPRGRPSDPSGESVARVTARRTALGEYFNQHDARLIAAAPEMVRLLLRIADCYPNHHLAPDFARSAYALLARIEGTPL
jgi:hypothetical protein